MFIQKSFSSLSGLKLLLLVITCASAYNFYIPKASASQILAQAYVSSGNSGFHQSGDGDGERYVSSGSDLSSSGDGCGACYFSGNGASGPQYNGDQSVRNSDPAISKEIKSLIDRINLLNKQIKTGISSSSTKETKVSPKVTGAVLCEVPRSNLSFGRQDDSNSSDVARLQRVLKQSGHFSGVETGYFGEKTRNAVQSFQREKGITASGNEKTTGYGMVGQKTRNLIKNLCEKKDVVSTSAALYTLSDVVSITVQDVERISNEIDDEYGLYKVILKDGSTRVFKRVGSLRNISFQERVKKTGYTGVIADLVAKATVLASDPVLKHFTIDDVKTITSRAVDPSTAIADDEYTEFKITLKSGVIKVVRRHSERGTVETREAPFRKAGYKGDVEALTAKAVVGTVLGASTTNMFGDITQKRIEALKKRIIVAERVVSNAVTRLTMLQTELKKLTGEIAQTIPSKPTYTQSSYSGGGGYSQGSYSSGSGGVPYAQGSYTTGGFIGGR